MRALVSSVSPPTAPRSRRRTLIIVVDDVVKTFDLGRGRLVEALKGVSLSIRPGEAWDSSASRIRQDDAGPLLGRSETPSSGRIEIDGIDASDFAALSKASGYGFGTRCR